VVVCAIAWLAAACWSATALSAVAVAWATAVACTTAVAVACAAAFTVACRCIVIHHHPSRPTTTMPAMSAISGHGGRGPPGGRAGRGPTSTTIVSSLLTATVAGGSGGTGVLGTDPGRVSIEAPSLPGRRPRAKAKQVLYPGAEARAPGHSATVSESEFTPGKCPSGAVRIGVDAGIAIKTATIECMATNAPLRRGRRASPSRQVRGKQSIYCHLTAR
jgi:hypothetical protein